MSNTRLEDIITIAEAAERWGIPKRTLYVDCTGQKGYPPRFTEGECRKAKGTWLVTRQAMERLYGDPKE